jgi:ribonuclease BN (tRNA processing enzyme)
MKLKALFLTHLHQDHTADYPTLLVIGPGAGLGSRKDPLTGKPVPLKVYGPCNRGQLEKDKTSFVARGGQFVYSDSADPAKITPTPGTAGDRDPGQPPPGLPVVRIPIRHP